MRKPHLALALVALAAAVAVAGPAAGQDRSGTVELTPFGGGSFGGTLNTWLAPGSNAHVDVGDAGTFGFHVGYNFSRYAAVEFGWAHAQAGLYTGPSGAFAPRQRVGDFDTDAFEVNGVFGFTRGKVVPYFTVGGGVNSMRLKSAGTSSSEARFVGNLGLGIKFWVTPRFGIRIEGRGRSTYVGSGQDCGSYYCRDSYYNDSNWYTSGEATGALTFAF